MSKNKENPIDSDKIAEDPHLLPYAHTLGSAIIRPIDKGKLKGLAMNAMYEQTGDKLEQIKEQIDILVKQAQSIHDRIDISEKIYEASYSFKPIIGNIYSLYSKDERYILSMISPEEWSNCPYEYIAKVQLLSDHTWKILNKSSTNPDIEL